MDSHNFHHDELLDRAVDAVLSDPLAGESSPDQVAQLVAVVRRAADQPSPITIIERIRNMRFTTKIAVAATISIAIVGLMSWITPGGGSALAFADLAEAIGKVRTATWKTTETIKLPDGKPQTTTGTGMFMAPANERIEMRIDKSVASIMILSGEKNRMITLSPMLKRAMIIDRKNFPAGAPKPSPFLGFLDMIASAKSGKGGEAKRLGIETIDGRRADVFSLQSKDAEMKTSVEFKIWADPKTSLPIRIETIVQGNVESRKVMSDFHFDVDLDRALFSADVPKGYTMQEMQMDFSKGPLCFVAEALGLAAEHNGGVFPPRLIGKQGIDGILQRSVRDLWKKNGINVPENGGMPPNEEIAKVAKLGKEKIEEIQKATNVLLMTKLPPALASLSAIRRHGEWHYAGKDVKLGTPNRPIFWCKIGDKYHVIYADASIKQVSLQDVPKVPQSEGSPQP
jgi:outer membrane lipoprotein-sorting protein